MKVAKSGLFILLGSLLLPAAQATNGYFAHGAGIKNRGLAGAGVAFPQDAMASATNPAGMAFVGNRLDVGMVLFSPDRGYRASSSLLNGSMGAFTVGPDSEDSGDDFFLIPSFGINKDINDRVSIGLSMYGNGGMNTTYDSGSAAFDPTGMGGAGVSVPGVLGDGTAGVDLAQLFVNLSYAYKFTEDFSVGISPIFVVQSFRANGLNAFIPFTKTFNETGNFAAADSLTQNGTEYSYGAGVQVGLLARNVMPSLDIGISYRSKMYMSRFEEYSDLFAENGDFDIPSTLWAGFAYDFMPNLTFVFDYQRIWYEDIDSISNGFENLFACPSAGQGGTNVEACLGGDDGAGFGWRDMDIFKFGLQWQADASKTFRIGYSHGSNPIGSSQTLFNILAPGIIEDHVTAGMTFMLSDRSEINLEAMHALEESQKGANPFDPTQNITLRMNQWEVGGSYSYRF